MPEPVHARHPGAATGDLLRISGVGKWYGSYHALRDVSLAVQARERIVVCGPSGSGKSTLIRCINGIEPFESGEIEVCGVKLTPGAGDLASVRRNVGMVFQQFNLFPHMTVLENCTLAPVANGRMGAHDAELDPEMVKEVLDTMAVLALGGMSMVCVTHEMGFARQVADRVVFMDEGQILEIAPPEEFFASPRHDRTQAFLGDILR